MQCTSHQSSRPALGRHLWSRFGQAAVRVACAGIATLALVACGESRAIVAAALPPVAEGAGAESTCATHEYELVAGPGSGGPVRFAPVPYVRLLLRHEGREALGLFLVDTGAAPSAIDSGLVATLGAIAADGRVSIDELILPPNLQTDLTFLSQDMGEFNAHADPQQTQEGRLGTSFLLEYVLDLDITRGRMRLANDATCLSGLPGSRVSLTQYVFPQPLGSQTGIPTMLLDTGASTVTVQLDTGLQEYADEDFRIHCNQPATDILVPGHTDGNRARLESWGGVASPSVERNVYRVDLQLRDHASGARVYHATALVARLSVDGDPYGSSDPMCLVGSGLLRQSPRVVVDPMTSTLYLDQCECPSGYVRMPAGSHTVFDGANPRTVHDAVRCGRVGGGQADSRSCLWMD